MRMASLCLAEFPIACIFQAKLPFALDMGAPKTRGYFLVVPHNKDDGILGSILGSPLLGKCHMLRSNADIPWLARGCVCVSCLQTFG